jgi:hypothetical protein
MPTIADFLIVEEDSVTLPKAGTDDIDHDYPEFDLTDVATGGRSVLMFRVNPSGTSVTLQVTLNDESVLTQTFDSEPQRSWHEVVQRDILKETENKLTITRTGGPGSVTVSDVVLLHQAAI